MATDVAHLVDLARVADAAGNTTYLSTGESLAAALILNRADWLAGLGCTLAEAIDRMEADWLTLIPEAARRYRDMKAATAQVMRDAREAATVASLAELGTDADPIDFNARLVTYGNAPGYREMNLRVELRRIGRNADNAPVHADIRFNAADTLAITEHAIGIIGRAWKSHRGRDLPLDHKEGEAPPRWLERLDASDVRGF